MKNNSDTVGNVYGASDQYLLVNFKSAVKIDVGNDMTAKFSVGVDNILNEKYYDHHPYPQRTYFANYRLRYIVQLPLILINLSCYQEGLFFI